MRRAYCEICAALMAIAVASISSDGAEQIAEPVRLTHDGFFKERPHWSSDGKRLLFTMHRGSTISLYVWNREAMAAQRLSTRQEPEFDGAWSPDGTKIAFTFDKTSPNQGNQEIYVCEADGAQPRQIAGDSGTLSHEEWPSWSPDGNSLVYVSTRHGNAELYISRSSGGDERRLTNDPALDAHPAWSPDGKQIAFATNRWGDWELALVDATAGTVQRLTTSAGLDDYPAWSPDGRCIAFTSNRSGNLDIYVLTIATGDVTNISQHPSLDNFPAWSPDGGLTWVSNRSRGFDLYSLPKVP